MQTIRLQVHMKQGSRMQAALRTHGCATNGRRAARKAHGSGCNVCVVGKESSARQAACLLLLVASEDTHIIHEAVQSSVVTCLRARQGAGKKRTVQDKCQGSCSSFVAPARSPALHLLLQHPHSRLQPTLTLAGAAAGGAGHATGRGAAAAGATHAGTCAATGTGTWVVGGIFWVCSIVVVQPA